LATACLLDEILTSGPIRGKHEAEAGGAATNDATSSSMATTRPPSRRDKSRPYLSGVQLDVDSPKRRGLIANAGGEMDRPSP